MCLCKLLQQGLARNAIVILSLCQIIIENTRLNLPYISLHFIQLQLSLFFTNQSVCTALDPHPNMDLTFLWAMSDRDCLLVWVFIYLYLSSCCFPCMHLRCSWDDHIGLHPTARWGNLKSALHLASLKDICASSARDSSSE